MPSEPIQKSMVANVLMLQQPKSKKFFKFLSSKNKNSVRKRLAQGALCCTLFYKEDADRSRWAFYPDSVLSLTARRISNYIACILIIQASRTMHLIPSA